MSPETEKAASSHEIEIQWGVPKPEGVPADATLVSWVRHALQKVSGEPAEVSIRLMSIDEMAGLNSRYRGRQGATNVLSFPAGNVEHEGPEVLGDIAVCADVVADEARQQGKSPAAHLAHMLVHGVMHLCGYDHREAQEAQEMEAVEVEIMADLGFGDPYDPS